LVWVTGTVATRTPATTARAERATVTAGRVPQLTPPWWRNPGPAGGPDERAQTGASGTGRRMGSGGRRGVPPLALLRRPRPIAIRRDVYRTAPRPGRRRGSAHDGRQRAQVAAEAVADQLE